MRQLGTAFDEPAPFSGRSVNFGRIRGMLLGVAIGDALGNTTESMLPHERRKAFGEIRNFLPNRRADGRLVGLPSDDTQLTFWTVEHLISCGALDPDALAQTFASRRNFGVGQSVMKFVRRRQAGLPWVEAAGNGALMRIAPVVLLHLRQASSNFGSMQRYAPL